MSYRLALNLTHEGIALLVDTGAHWSAIGAAEFSSPDLADQLGALRQKAQDVAGEDFVTRLILPNSQVMYSKATSSGISEDEDDARVREALDGATPYRVEDLAYDWIAEDMDLQIAVVARETLQEAENFARDHGFNPVAFVAIPEAGAFDGEPYFGDTDLARDLLSPEEMPERLGAAIQIGEPLSDDEIADLIQAQNPAPEPPHEEEPEEQEPPVDPLVEDALDFELANRAAAEVSTPEADVEEEPIPAFTSIRGRREPALSSPKADPALTPEEPAALPEIPLRAAREAHVPTPPAAPRIEPPARIAPAATAASQHAEDSTVIARMMAAVDKVSESVEGRSSKSASAVTASEAESMTVFGARKSAASSGGPKLGLILTVLLLALLIAVGVWSSIFLKDAVTSFFDSSDPAEQLDLASPSFDPDGAVPEGLTSDEPEVPIRPVAPPVVDDTSTQLTRLEEPGAAVPLPPRATPDTVFEEELADEEPEPLSDSEAAATYAATGIWQRTPDNSYEPVEDTLENLYVASIDPNAGQHDAIDLPRDVLRNTDSIMARPSNPPAPGASTVLDARGLVIPSRNGTLSPDGIFVFAGRPPVVPPVRPSVSAPSPTDPLAEARPKARPANLVEEAEKSQLGGRTRLEMVGLRPKARPESVRNAAQAIQAAQQAAAAALAEAKAREEAELEAKRAAEAAADASGEASDLAVASSLRPKDRPRGLERQAERRRETAASASTASVAPTRAAVSRAQRLKPAAPTPAGAARQATVKNAINLGRVNLIGVYGSPSKRRALVRLSSGRYVKVQVGDRVDGGRVAAIGESELRYVKSGRNVVLKMPKG